eukprot:29412-Pelagococcus_subviridis.AAC.3
MGGENAVSACVLFYPFFGSYLCTSLYSSMSALNFNRNAPPIAFPNMVYSCCNSLSCTASNSANIPGLSALSATAPMPRT